jgi:hypothetical protein
MREVPQVNAKGTAVEQSGTGHAAVQLRKQTKVDAYDECGDVTAGTPPHIKSLAPEATCIIYLDENHVPQTSSQGNF